MFITCSLPGHCENLAKSAISLVDILLASSGICLQAGVLSLPLKKGTTDWKNENNRILSSSQRLQSKQNLPESPSGSGRNNKLKFKYENMPKKNSARFGQAVARRWPGKSPKTENRRYKNNDPKEEQKRRNNILRYGQFAFSTI